MGDVRDGRGYGAAPAFQRQHRNGSRGRDAWAWGSGNSTEDGRSSQPYSDSRGFPPRPPGGNAEEGGRGGGGDAFQRVCDHERRMAMAQLTGRKFAYRALSKDVPREALFTGQAFALPALMDSKTELNTTKDKLNDKDISVWGKHTGFTNLAGDVVRVLRNALKPEMCTSAWAKMYECIQEYDLLPVEACRAQCARPDQPAVMTAHVCEAPGAFICATNHFVRTKMKGFDWGWVGLTLNPYHEGNDLGAMVDDDALIKETMGNWCFGKDNSGDIRKPDSIREMWRRCRAEAERLGVPGPFLVTGDGSIDCQENPNEQEMTTAPLHYDEMVCMAGMLAKGGSLVIKAFTLFEHPTVCLLYILACLFDQICVFKPATSKPGNSEVYIIGKGFRGISDELLEAMLQHVGKDVFHTSAMLPLELLDPAFVEEAQRCAKVFADAQRETIELNIQRENRLSGMERKAIYDTKTWFAGFWIKHYDVQPLLPRDFIAPGANLTGSNNNTSNALGRRKRMGGTLADRQEQYKRRREGWDGGDGAEAPADMQGGAGAAGGGNGTLYAPGAPEGAGARGTSGVEDLQDAGTSKAMAMMRKMGFAPGSGLGARGQGITAPVEAYDGPSRAGLGSDAPPDASLLALVPYADELTNEDLLVPPLDGWLEAQTVAELQPLRRSKFFAMESALLQLKTSREGHRSRLGSWTACPHALPCMSVAGSGGGVDASFWHLSCVLRAFPDVASGSKGPQDRLRVLDLSPSGLGPLQRLAATGRPISAAVAGARDGLDGLGAWGDVTCAVLTAGGSPGGAGLSAASAERLTDQFVALGQAHLVLGWLAPSEEVAGSFPAGSADAVLELERVPAVRGRLLWEALCGILALAEGGNLVLRVPDCLTRATVGVLYVLHRSFARTHVARAGTQCAASPDRLVVLRGFLGLRAAAKRVLSAALDRHNALGDGCAEELADVVPPAEYMGSAFFKYICTRNALLGKHEVERRNGIAGAAARGEARRVAVAEACDALGLPDQARAQLEAWGSGGA